MKTLIIFITLPEKYIYRTTKKPQIAKAILSKETKARGLTLITAVNTATL
jgi:hypothetical protein